MSSSSSSSSSSSLVSLDIMDPGSKYFFIKSELNGLVLDVTGAGTDPDTKVITWTQKEEGYDNQLFFEHPVTGTIRPKHAPHLVLAVPDDGSNTLVLSECSPGSSCQRWVCTDNGCVCCRDDHGRVLDIAACNDEPGARVCAWEDNSKPHQRWTFVFQEREYFYVRSKMHGMVLDISGEDASPGASVITWDMKDGAPAHQLWYEDCHGFLRSKLNDLVLDTSEGKLQMAEYSAGSDHQQWCVDGDFIRNPALSDQVLDIRGAEHDGGADVIPYAQHGGENQLWEAVHA